MMWSYSLLFYLVFAVVSGEPEPNVNIKINVNVNGESEESQESGMSCNLVWNSEEYRPLIMIRETKTIVPPVDAAISKDPNRIPIGVKLVFACAGQFNIFNHFVGNQTKLHGECFAGDQFKVCFNNSPVYLDLNRLACSRNMFPSFIKQDNGTSDDNGCDELGGQLYRQGYTYGDYHEFKDLEIDVCFHMRNQTSICTSPNINGNESDYSITRRINELQGRETRAGSSQAGSSSSSSIACLAELQVPYQRKYTNDGKKCVKEHGKDAECNDYDNSNQEWCYYGKGVDKWNYCGVSCTFNNRFINHHLCVVGDDNNKRDCVSDKDAEAFCKKQHDAGIIGTSNTVFSYEFDQNNGFADWAWDGRDNKLVGICRIPYYVPSWRCQSDSIKWKCFENGNGCSGGGKFNRVIGHLPSDSVECLAKKK